MDYIGAFRVQKVDSTAMIKKILGAGIAIATLAACSSNKPKVDEHGHDPSVHEGETKGDVKTKEDGTRAALTKLEIEDVVVGKGEPVAAGDEVWVRYTGKLANGTEFDSNEKGDKPLFNFTAGPMGSVIKGWQEGIIGAKAGGTRNVSVPWNMAYGEAGQGPIPPKADLYFTIKVEQVVKAGKQNEVERTTIKKGNGATVKQGSTVVIDAVGKLMDGKEIDEAKNYSVKVGGGEVIPGVDAGLVGMQVGGTYSLRIPPRVAFGPMGKPPIVPPNSFVIYEITVKQAK